MTRTVLAQKKPLTDADLHAALADSPALGGTPTAPTAVQGTDSTQIATTEFVQDELTAKTIRRTINSPAPQANREFGISQDQFNLPENGGYQNIVQRWGYNIGRPNTSEPSAHFSIESKYLLNNVGPYVMEFHIEGQHADGTPWRMFSAIEPVNQADANTGSSAGFNTQIFQLATKAGSQRIKWDWVANEVFYVGSQLHRIGVNNAAFWTQLNAAGNSYLTYPYIDNQDRYYITQPIYVINTATTAKPSQAVVAIASGANPTIRQTNVGGSPTGTVRLDYFTASNNGPAIIEILNNGTNAASNAEISLLVNAGGGDPCVRMGVNGGAGVVQGYDRSAGVYRIADLQTGYYLGAGGQIVDLNPSTKHAKFYGNVVSTPASSITLGANGELAIEATSNTSLTVKYRGSDGTTRSTTLTLS